MDNNTKQLIADDLRKYLQRFESQNKGAATLKNISVANISHMVNGKWQQISDEKWRTVEKQLKEKNSEWIFVPTTSSNDLFEFYKDASEQSLTFGLIGKASLGKSASAMRFKGTENNISVVTCEPFTRRVLMIEILNGFGIKDAESMSSYNMSKKLIEHVLATKDALIVFDEADKLNRECLCYFISLYNKLEDKCGMIMQGTKALREKFKSGLLAGRTGYEESYSRLDLNFIDIEEDTEQDFYNIIYANGVTEPEHIYAIINDSSYDKRRVKKKVKRYKMKGGIAA